MKTAIIVSLCLVLCGSMSAVGWSGYVAYAPAPPALVAQPFIMDMTASWYGPGFHGRIGANGRPFDAARVSAAHRTLPLGTMLEVSYEGRSLVVIVTDRGPYWPNRQLDLSESAAQLLGFIEAGVVPVKVRIVCQE